MSAESKQAKRMREQPVNISRTFLLGFGGTSFVTNTCLYFALHNNGARYRGAVQAGLAILGGLCFLIGLMMRRGR